MVKRIDSFYKINTTVYFELRGLAISYNNLTLRKEKKKRRIPKLGQCLCYLSKTNRFEKNVRLILFFGASYVLNNNCELGLCRPPPPPPFPFLSNNRVETYLVFPSFILWVRFLNVRSSYVLLTIFRRSIAYRLV